MVIDGASPRVRARSARNEARKIGVAQRRWQASRASIETVSWLRIIGYNAVSAWRQQAPRQDRKPVAWARAMETFRDDSAGTRAGEAPYDSAITGTGAVALPEVVEHLGSS